MWMFDKNLLVLQDYKGTVIDGVEVVQFIGPESRSSFWQDEQGRGEANMGQPMELDATIVLKSASH